MRVKRGGLAKMQVLKKALASVNREGKVGWFPSAKYEDGTPVAEVAYKQEFGGRNVPPRLGMRGVEAAKRAGWADTAKKIMKSALAGGIPGEKVMELMLLRVGGDIAQHISKVTSPPLSPATVNARLRRLADGGRSVKGVKGGAGVAGVEKPLIDTGILLGTLSYEIDGAEHLVTEGGK